MTSACFSRGHTGFSRNATLVATVNPPALAGGVFNLSNKINSFKIFYNPIEKFFRKISVYYNKYRKERQIEHRFYSQDSGLKRRLDSAELDILILTHLVIARKLLSFREIKYNLSDGWLATVKSIFLCYKAQVYVDEAPDFSLVQLLCMRLLTLPEITSFFACGDFNQRITDCGINSIDEFRGCPACFLILKGVVISSHETNRFS